jgi:hypothetical protein
MASWYIREHSPGNNKDFHSTSTTGMFGGPEVSYHQTYSARDWFSILRTPYRTQNLQRKRRTDILF